MDLFELLKQTSPPLLYLGATIYLFRKLEAALEKHRLDLTMLLERYHQLATTFVQTLHDLTEKLNDSND